MSTSSVLPADHPPVKKPKIGILLLNLGTPDATDYWSMRRYLSEFLSDKRVIDYPSWFWQPLLQGIILTSRPFRSGKAYKSIWNMEENESPLKTFTRAQCDKRSDWFEGRHQDIEVEWGMRYGNPSTDLALKSLQDRGCTRILCFALYPQYSAATTATAYDKVFDYLQQQVWQPAVRTAQPYHDDPLYIQTLAASIEAQLSQAEKPVDHMVVSFHGLPKRYLTEKGDPYHCQCQKTSRLLREYLQWPEEYWTTVFQSRFGPEEWLQPYAEETVLKLAADGKKNIALISPGFASECVETLEELNIELREKFIEAGGENLTYIPCLNDSNAHIMMLGRLIENELAGWI